MSWLTVHRHRLLPGGILKRELDRIDEEYADDHDYEEATDEALHTASLLFSQPGDEEHALSEQMKEWASKTASQRDSTLKELGRWLDAHIRPGGKRSNERVIIFMKYRATCLWQQRIVNFV